MYYYAQYSPYGVRVFSHGDRLYRFTTRAARDTVVDNEAFGMTFDGSNFHWDTITREQARHWYPDAFRTFDDNPFDVYSGWTPAEKIGGEMWTSSATGGEYRYF
jgi:hypothetical protein